MKLIVPDYYTRFRCTAGDCRHSCCIGWEIDIDEDTCSRYRSVEGDFGRRLEENIEYGETPCFRLDGQERCPFLNKDNLCDIIINLGQDALCQICADHPRFRNFFDSRTEMGLGLCCEAAAALILGCEEPVRLITLEDDGCGDIPDGEEYFFAMRDSIIAALQDRSKPFDGRLEAVMTGYGVTVPRKSMSDWARVYSSLERLEDGWGDRLAALAAAPAPPPVLGDTVREQLLVYFAFRHLADGMSDGSFRERLAFCILSVMMIDGLCAVCGEPVTEITRMYSSEIEYSDENIQRLLDVLGGETV